MVAWFASIHVRTSKYYSQRRWFLRYLWDIQRPVRVGARNEALIRVCGSVEPEPKKLFTALQQLVVESFWGDRFLYKIKEQVFVNNNIMRKNWNPYCLTSKTFWSKSQSLTLYSTFRIYQIQSPARANKSAPSVILKFMKAFQMRTNTFCA